MGLLSAVALTLSLSLSLSLSLILYLLCPHTKKIDRRILGLKSPMSILDPKREKGIGCKKIKSKSCTTKYIIINMPYTFIVFESGHGILYACKPRIEIICYLVKI